MTGSKTDQVLLREFAERASEIAFQSLVERHVDLVFATALRRVGNPGAAQEVTQDVFISLARKAVWLRSEVSLAGWLHKTALLHARQWWRAEHRRQRREESAAELGTTMKQNDTQLNALAAALDDGLMELPDADRQTLMLHYFEGRNYREVGALLGIGEDAARKRAGKALNQLTAFFRRRHYVLPALAATEVALRAGAHAAPVELAAIATKAALSAGSAVSAGSLGLLLAKLMGLTKTQTAVACLLIAAAPVAYQWHALAEARSTQRQLTAELTGLRESINSQERVIAGLERRIRYTDALLAAQTDNSDANRLKSGSMATAANLYLWDEQSDYVRLPKSLMPHLTFGEFKMEPRGVPRGSAPPERVQLPPIARDGTPSPALLDALGLTDAEAKQVSDITRQTFEQFAALAERYSYLTNQTYSPQGALQSITLFTPAFAQSGGMLQQDFFQLTPSSDGPATRPGFFAAGRKRIS
jgi:RNA polymerase sigma factor (sigma-70 family)